jgi:hypothetical protein
LDAKAWADTVSIIPIEARGKKPLISWAEYQQRRAGWEEREEWKNKFPGCNWGLVTGKISGLVALDFDGEEGYALRKEKNVYGAIPTNLTGKGCHCLFRHPDREIRNGARLLPGLDVRGDGGYIVIPPSIHPSGKKYGWQIPPWMVPDLPELPEWVWPLVDRSNGNGAPPTVSNESTRDGLPPGAAKGTRNATATRVAGQLFRKGLSEAAVIAVIREWNKKNCPPLSEKELLQVVQSIGKAEHRQNPPTLLVSGVEFVAEKMDASRTLIDPIMPDPARIILAGFAGVGKTSLAMNQAAAHSAGLPFLGWQAARKTVLYIDGENPRPLVQKRLGIIFNAMGGNLRSIHFAFPERKLDLGIPAGLSELEGMIGRTGAGIVVLDSFLNFFSLKSENDSAETRRALDGLTALMRMTGCSVLILDHTTKPLREARGRGEVGPPTPRGSGAKVDFADVVLVLEEKKSEGRFLKTLHFTKLRGHPPMRPLILEMDGRLCFRPVGEDAVVPVEIIREAVEMDPGIRTGDLLRCITNRTGAGDRTIYRAIDRAEAQKLICRVQQGRTVLLYPVGGLLPLANDADKGTPKC